AHLESEPAPAVRLAAARVLAVWATGDARRAGEEELIAHVNDTSDSAVRETAIRALATLRVREAGPVIARAATTADGTLRRTAVEALARLGDRAFVELLNDMLTLDDLDGWESRWALHFAGANHELAFVPALIARLSDRRSNDAFSSTADGQIVAHTLGEDAHWALRRLTFQDFDADPQTWRDWWASNRNTTLQTQLQRYVERVL